MFDLLKAVFKYKQKRSPDVLGLYPESVHTSAIPERRYLWSSRLLVIFASLCICFNMMLISVLYVILPQRGANPRLLKKDDYFSQLTLLTPQELYVMPRDLINENFIREYVMLRHTVTSTYDELKRRWDEGSKFYWMSDRSVYNEFASDNLEDLIQSYQHSGFVRSVDIEWVRLISNGLWVVRFATYDYYHNVSTPLITIWHAYIRAALALVNYDNKSLRYQNPFGFFITSYSLSYVGTPNDARGYMQMARDRRLKLHY